MFRAAFPNASEHDEKTELQWVRDNYDLTANNGGALNASVTRLAGTWVGPTLARTLGNAYSLGILIDAVVEANPDPKANYRRSNKAAASVNGSAIKAPATSTGAISASHAAAKSLPTPSPTNAPSPAKRRKETSPPVSSDSLQPIKVPLPRRSARTKSPAPRAAAIIPLTARPKTPQPDTRVAKRQEIVTPGGSDETAVDEEDEGVEDGVAGSELRHQDIAEQKKLIEDLKAKRDAEARSKAVHEADESMEEEQEEATGTLKRVREEEEVLKFEFKEPEVGERVIATNRRVGRFQMEPRTKSFAWGVAAFALGMGAV
jgi:hypothetical protein